MPDVRGYLEGFNLYEGLKMSKYEIKHIDITHKETVRWNQYIYPTKITFTSKESVTPRDVDILENNFLRYIDKEIIIRTESGRPYLCIFAQDEVQTSVSKSNKTVIFECVGHAKRVSEKVASLY